MMVDITLYPWEDIDAAIRQQAEDEIWSDAEHDAWLTALFADQQAALDGGDPYYERWIEAGAPRLEGHRTWSLLDDAAVVADILPDWQRDEYIGL